MLSSWNKVIIIIIIMYRLQSAIMVSLSEILIRTEPRQANLCLRAFRNDKF